MATLIVCIIAMFLSFFIGQFSIGLLLSGVMVLLGFIFTGLRRPACILFMLVICFSTTISSKHPLATLMPAIVLYLLRNTFSESVPQYLWGTWIIFLCIGTYSLSLQDHDIITCSFIAFALTLPVIPAKYFPYRSEVGTNASVFIHALSVIFILLVAMIISVVFSPRVDGKVAFLDCGVWARPEVKMKDVNGLNIESSYSYSELAELLNAETIKPEEINIDFSEAWMITPTQPFKNDEIKKMFGWIREGGRLIVVTDHTDLFGHARVANMLLAKFRADASTTAFFPRQVAEKVDFDFGNAIWLKTTNTQSGWFLWPQVTARWVEEECDYSNKNFFGPLSISADDSLGRRVICGSLAYGKGRVVILGDSTVLANFALYQPRIIPFLERIRFGGVFCKLLPFIWFCALLGIVAGIFFSRNTLLLSLPIVGLFSIMACKQIPVLWSNFDFWSGNETAVMEYGNPEQRLSTAYSTILLSGKKPRWISSPPNSISGFWVDTEPPPTDKWRWVDIGRTPEKPLEYDHRLAPLLLKISGGNPSPWPMKTDSRHIKIGNVWTDNALGDWWFDRGISRAKQMRINAWIAWLNNCDMPLNSNPIDLRNYQTKEYVLQIESGQRETLLLPEIPTKNENELFLGRGVSAQIVSIDNNKALIGMRPYTESWNCARRWVLVPYTVPK